MSYKVEYLSPNLFGGEQWGSNDLRYGSEPEARASLLPRTFSPYIDVRFVESTDPVNAVWDYEQGRYSPVEEGAS